MDVLQKAGVIQNDRQIKLLNASVTTGESPKVVISPYEEIGNTTEES